MLVLIFYCLEKKMADGFNAIGCSNHTKSERAKLDFYATDPVAVDVLVKECTDFKLHHKIWECACGAGHISENLKKYGYKVFCTDIVDRGFNDKTFDFLYYNNDHLMYDIVTNPPYSDALAFIKKALSLIEDGYYVVMFLKIQFLEGKKRKEFFKNNPPKYIYVFSKRVQCAKNGSFNEMKEKGGSTICYAWYVWEKGYKGNTILKWVN